MKLRRFEVSSVAPALLVVVVWMRLSVAIALPPPQIEFIEPFLTKQVLVHFNTEPNRAYVLQYTSSFTITNGVVSATWSNLYSVPSFPFEGHYIVPDWRTNTQRFYRLVATP